MPFRIWLTPLPNLKKPQAWRLLIGHGTVRISLPSLHHKEVEESSNWPPLSRDAFPMFRIESNDNEQKSTAEVGLADETKPAEMK